MSIAENRRRNKYAANCCKCQVFVDCGQGWLYQDTQSRQSRRDAGIKKHWKVKCEGCHSGDSVKQEDTPKKISIMEIRKLIAQHGKRFNVAISPEWDGEKITTFDDKPLDNFVITSYQWVSPEQFVFLTTGNEVSDFDMTDKAYALLESFCLDLDLRRESQEKP